MSVVSYFYIGWGYTIAVVFTLVDGPDYVKLVQYAIVPIAKSNFYQEFEWRPGKMSTMGELNYRFERAVFAALGEFDLRLKDPKSDPQQYSADLQHFVRSCEDIRSTLDIAEYEKKLEEFEKRFN